MLCCIALGVSWSDYFMCIGLVILTDGVLGFTSPSTMHNAVNQMRGANTSCWVIQVCPSHPIVLYHGYHSYNVTISYYMYLHNAMTTIVKSL